MLHLQSATENVIFPVTGTVSDGRFCDSGGTLTTGLSNGNPFAGIASVQLPNTLNPGHGLVYAVDGGGLFIGGWPVNVVNELPAVPSDIPTPLNAAGVRSAVGLAAANLDTQLAALTPLSAAGVRAAVGLAAANLDTQLAALTPLSAAGVRAAVGLAAANLDTQLAAITPGLDAAGVRAAVGLAAANLDTQLAALTPLGAAAIRAALGLGSANLDAQLAAIGVPLTAAAIRQAVGLAAANLDAQFANIGPAGISPTGIRQALGVARPNLDEEIGRRDVLLEELLSRFPQLSGESVGSRR